MRDKDRDVCEISFTGGVCWSPSTRYVVVRSETNLGVVWVWDMSANKRTVLVHPMPVTSVRFHAVRDCAIICTQSRVVCVWTPETVLCVPVSEGDSMIVSDVQVIGNTLLLLDTSSKTPHLGWPWHLPESVTSNHQ
eukprot:c18237_g1_i1.p1 GENE.c18237_g1_i1~~c18237_g1_i1.p1  ORF type:complete len:145 (+),score=36.47 c18237_g1_i1:28-435(+)